MDNKKIFIKPEALVIDFQDGDIITFSIGDSQVPIVTNNEDDEKEAYL